ncbi:M23 family metallopeptidase [Fundidesulfovibrio butyratiphilus]
MTRREFCLCCGLALAWSRTEAALAQAEVARAAGAGQAMPGPGNTAETVWGPLRVVCPVEVEEGDPFLILVKTDTPCERISLAWLGKNLDVPLASDGRGARAEVLLGAGLGVAAGEYVLTVEAAFAGRRETAMIHVPVRAKAFPEQRLSLPRAMVTPSPQALARIRREREEIAKVLALVSPRRLWTLPLVRPVPGPISSAFGLRRVLNGQPRAPHRGIDFRAALGEPVACLSAGRVLLTGDYYFNGRSVFVDHGQGVLSMYFHLSRVDVAEGGELSAGQTVGLVGATGRSTGPHLHLGFLALGQAVDPSPLMRGIR